MSSTLCWQIVRTDAKHLSDALKYALREFRGESLGSDPITFDEGSVTILKAMAAGSSSKELKKDCETLIAAIEKHGEIELWEAY